MPQDIRCTAVGQDQHSYTGNLIRSIQLEFLGHQAFGLEIHR